MKSVKNSVIPRTLLALALLAAAPAVLAQSAYDGTTIQQGTNPTTALALAPDGTVVVGVQSGAFGQSFNTYKTGANGAGGLTAFGPTFTGGGNSNGFAVCTFCNATYSVVAAQNNGIAANINNYVGSDEDEGFSGIKNSGVILTATGNNYLGNGTVVAGINSALSAVGTIEPQAGNSGLGGYFPSHQFTSGGQPAAYGYSYEGGSPQSVGPKNTGTFVTNPTPTVVVSNTMPTPFIELAAANNTSALIYSNAVGATFRLGTPTPIATLGFGGFGTAINSRNEAVGTDFTSASDTNTRAFITGVNGVGVTFLGVANGVSSAATAVNNSGEIGGFITLTDGTTEAFLTAGSTLMVGLDSTSDSRVDFLNNAGEAIVQDDSGYYLYNAGSLISISSLFTPAQLAGLTIDGVAGLNDAGQILLEVSDGSGDPGLLSTPTGETLPVGSDIRDSTQFAEISSDVGAPDPSFFVDQTGLAPTSGGSSVPEPGLAGLLALGLAAGFMRRKRAVVGG